jgi:hypothetical protein
VQRASSKTPLRQLPGYHTAAYITELEILAAGEQRADGARSCAVQNKHGLHVCTTVSATSGSHWSRS